RILNSAGPKQKLPKHVSCGNISGAHVPKTVDAFEGVFCENVRSAPDVPSFIQLKRFEKTHIGSISFGAENRPF
ncbi:hypothetical protein, partial [Paenibacillus lautus]|uniref:hypothetical protein n=1 Tax=Paenibacillus lautus TaxID=1401 RepID=UPI003D27E804